MPLTVSVSPPGCRPGFCASTVFSYQAVENGGPLPEPGWKSKPCASPASSGHPRRQRRVATIRRCSCPGTRMRTSPPRANTVALPKPPQHGSALEPYSAAMGGWAWLHLFVGCPCGKVVHKVAAGDEFSEQHRAKSGDPPGASSRRDAAPSPSAALGAVTGQSETSFQ